MALENGRNGESMDEATTSKRQEGKEKMIHPLHHPLSTTTSTTHYGQGIMLHAA